MTSERLAWLLVGCLAIAPGMAAGQETVALSLDQAVARALAHAPRLAESRARERAAAETTAARAASGRPTVAALAGVTRTNHVDEFGITQPNGDRRVIFPDIPTNYRVRAELDVPLYTAGRVDALVRSAEADRTAAGAEAASAEADVELETVLAYWTLAMGRAQVAVLEAAQARADALVDDVTARVDTGLLPPNERLTAEARRARQRVRLIEAENAAAAAEMDLARLVGFAPGVSIELTTPVAAEPAADGVAAGADPAALAEQAASTRPERQALDARVLSAEAAAEAAAALTRPQISALAAIEPSRPNPRFVPRVDDWNTSWDLGLTVRWPIFDGGQARAQRAAALAGAEAARARVSDFEARVAVDVRQRHLDVESARAGLEAAGEAVDAAREARRVVGERFEVGVATTSDVLDADVALLEAELEETRLAIALHVSRARLMRSAGVRR